MHLSSVDSEPFSELIAVARGSDPNRPLSRAWIADKVRLLVAGILIVGLVAGAATIERTSRFHDHLGEDWICPVGVEPNR